MNTVRNILFPALAVALITVAGCDFTQDAPPEPKLAAFGTFHSPLGDATLKPGDESVTVEMEGAFSAGGVAVEMDARTRLNVYFEPIEMPVGSQFETAVVGRVDDAEEVLGRITHKQTAPRTTTIGADFRDLLRYTDSDRVTVSTYLDGVQTSAKKVSADSTETLGFVDSADSEWATSYHWLYIDGAWILMIDPAPSETFTFASEPGVKHPFNYLVFTIDGVKQISRPRTMEFVGEGIPDFTVVGADDRRLLF